MTGMHDWTDQTELFARSVLEYATERLRVPKDPHWGAHPANELAMALDGAVSPTGIGAEAALNLFRDVLMPACRPMESPLNLAYVPTAPTPAAALFDLVVSASSIFGGNWETGAGAIAAENQAIRWLADLAGFPGAAGGVFVSGGSAANLSALVTARSVHRERRNSQAPLNNQGAPRRLAFAASPEAHSSVRATANVMDVDIVAVPVDDLGRMTGQALSEALASTELDVFAVVTTGGTTNAGAIDRLAEIADVCSLHDNLWLHVDGAYGLAALCAPSARPRFSGIERADSFGVDPHKWLFAPYDCAALVYRDPYPASIAHAQHGDYLAAVDRTQWNPSDYAYHLSRRVRGLPLWYSLATYGTEAYSVAMETTLASAKAFAEEIKARDGFTLLLEPELSIVLFTIEGWSLDDYLRWSRQRAKEGFALLVPTFWRGEPCMRICVVNPQTTIDMLRPVIDDLAAFTPTP